MSILLSSSRLCQTDFKLAKPRRCADPGSAASIYLPRATRGYPPGLGDTGRAALGRAGSFNPAVSGSLRGCTCLFGNQTPFWFKSFYRCMSSKIFYLF